MGNPRTESIDYDDVNSAVQRRLECGVPLNEISLRMIREEMGDRGSLSTISKHFDMIRKRLEHGEAIDATDLTDVDMTALRTLVSDIVERRTFLARKEQEAHALAMADVMREYEANLAEKTDIIDDLEHHVFALEGECGALQLVNDANKLQLAQYEGRVEALNGTIALLTLAIPASADGLPVAQNLPADHLSALQTLRVARVGPLMMAKLTAEAQNATGEPSEGI